MVVFLQATLITIIVYLLRALDAIATHSLSIHLGTAYLTHRRRSYSHSPTYNNNSGKQLWAT